MMIFKKTVFLAFLVLMACYATTANACDCMPPNMIPRNGCRDSFIAVVTLTGKKLVDDFHLNFTYKLVKDATHLLPKKQSLQSIAKVLSTAENSALCGVELAVNQTYLIKGDLTSVATLNSCTSYMQKLTSIPSEEQIDILFNNLIKKLC